MNFLRKAKKFTDFAKNRKKFTKNEKENQMKSKSPNTILKMPNTFSKILNTIPKTLNIIFKKSTIKTATKPLQALKNTLKFTLFLSLFYTQSLAVSSIEERQWAKNEFFLKFLENNSLPSSLYWDLDASDKELASEIKEGERFMILWNDDKIEQILIPVSGSDLQLHIFRDKKGDFTLRYTPVSFQTQTRLLKINIENSAYQDIESVTGSSPLARAVRNAFAGSIDFRANQRGDELILLYERKERLGQRYGEIVLKMASIEVNRKPHRVYLYKDSFYDSNGKEMESFLLATPVKYTRISSKFTRARYHPVLRKYRAHLGVDFAAPSGTPVKSAGVGTVSFVGTKGGYGKTVQINHGSGYSTLYAHLSRHAKIKRGQKVAQGQVIGYVGSTGLSSGPHLHFGLYQNNKAINPFSVVKITKAALKPKEKEDFKNVMKSYEDEATAFINAGNTLPPRESTGLMKYVEF